MEEEIDHNNQVQPETQKATIQVAKKPPSPYMLFLQKYKTDLKEGEKFNLKTVAEVWSTLDQNEKNIYVRQQQKLKEKYNDYLKACIDQGIEIKQQQKLNFAFPTTRVKNIMKQDPAIVCKAQTALAMNKAMQFFGEHMSSIIKRNIGGKKKLQLKDLWSAINTDKSLSFLQALIDDYSRTGKPQKKHISLQTQKSTQVLKSSQKKVTETIKNVNISNKRISSTQPTLNDLWK